MRTAILFSIALWTGEASAESIRCRTVHRGFFNETIEFHLDRNILITETGRRIEVNPFGNIGSYLYNCKDYIKCDAVCEIYNEAEYEGVMKSDNIK